MRLHVHSAVTLLSLYLLRDVLFRAWHAPDCVVQSIAGHLQQQRLTAEKRTRGTLQPTSSAPAQQSSAHAAPRQHSSHTSEAGPVSASASDSGAMSAAVDGGDGSDAEGAAVDAVGEGEPSTTGVHPGEDLHITAADLELMRELDINIGARTWQAHLKLTVF